MEKKNLLKCLEDFNWSGVKYNLDKMDSSDESFVNILNSVFHCHAFIIRYPGKEQKRNEILDKILIHIKDNFSNEKYKVAENVFTIFDIIDGAYRDLRKLIDDEPLSSHGPQYRLWALFSLFVDKQMSLYEKTSDLKTNPSFGSVFTFEEKDGTIKSIDGEVENLILSLSMNIKLSSYKGKWHKDKIIFVPESEFIDREEMNLAESSFKTAFLWREWQEVEEEARYLGGTLRLVKEKNIISPEEKDNSLILYTQSQGAVLQSIISLIANYRLNDYHSQVSKRIKGSEQISLFDLGKKRNLPPNNFISDEEKITITLLSNVLSVNVLEDTNKYGGLTLLEWIRGYSVLQVISFNKYKTSETKFEKILPEFDLDHIKQILEKNGFDHSGAEKFINFTSFSLESNDLYDCPIIRLGDSKCLIPLSAVDGTFTTRCILSQFSTNSFEVVQKGELFEEEFRKIFRDHNIPVYSFKETKDGEVYQYDAVAAWENYIFVFECKNHSTMPINPILKSNFQGELRKNIFQIKRLVNGLNKYDFLKKHVKEYRENSKIIPIVVNSMPFSLPKDHDGVYFSDAITIRRFFSSRYFSLRNYSNDIVDNERHCFSQWNGEHPHVADFLSLIDNPPQVQFWLKHVTEPEPYWFRIGPFLSVLTHKIQILKITEESFLSAYGSECLG